MIFFLLIFSLYFSFLLFLYSFKEILSFIDRLILSFLLSLLSLISFFPLFGYFNLINFYTFLFYILIQIFILWILTRVSFFPLLKEIKNFFYLFSHFLKNPFFFSFFLLLSIEVFFILRFSYFNAPDGWDTYSYHLPISSRILIEKGIPSYRGSETFYLKPHFFFPKNIEFLFSLYYLFTGSLKGLSIIHLLFLFFGVLSLYSILRKFKIEREKALFSFVLFFIPVIVQQSITAYVDIETGVLFIIFLNFLIINNNFSKFFSLLSLSLGAGTKYSFLPFFLIFLIYFSIHYFRERKYIYLISLIIFSLLSSLHFYIFNYINTKSIFPLFEMKFLKFIISKGEFKIEPYVFRFDPFEIASSLLEFSPFEKGRDYFYIYDNQVGGFGPVFIGTLSFIPLFIILFIAFKERNFRLFKIFIIFFLFYLFSPYKWWTRFMVFLLFFSIFSYIYLWERLKQKGISFFLIFLSLYSLFLSLNGIISRNPFIFLNDYKGKPFSRWIGGNISKSYLEISKYMKEYDTLYVYVKEMREKKFETQFMLMGLILEKSLFIRIEYVEDINPHYRKIVSSPFCFFEGYSLIYKDDNLALWVKR